MKPNRKLMFCLFTAAVLLALGTLTSQHNAYHWAFYVISSLLTVMAVSQLREGSSPLSISHDKASIQQTRT